MTTARAITKTLAAKSIARHSPKAIYLVLLDGDSTVCMTEAMLDTWWANLLPEQKAEIAEEFHDGPATFHPEAAMLQNGVAGFVDAINAQQKGTHENRNH